MHTDARAGELRSALHEELLPDLVLLLLALAFSLLAPTGALHEDLCDKRFADAHEATLIGPIGDWQDAAALKDIVRGVLPQLRVRFAPT